MLRCRPDLRSSPASLDSDSDSVAAAPGWVATESTARASRESRPTPGRWNAASAAGTYCRRGDLS
jgi:hypothetical protein